MIFDLIGFIEELLSDVWNHLEGISNDYRQTVLMEIPNELSDRQSYKYFITISNILSSYNAVRLLFKKKSELGVDDSGRLENLADFDEFSQYLITPITYEQRSKLVHWESSHFFGLSVLGSMVTCLDSMLYLQAEYGFQEILLAQQDECLHEGKTYVIDQCSAKRNQILVMAGVIGGPTERIIPSETLTEVSGALLPRIQVSGALLHRIHV